MNGSPAKMGTISGTAGHSSALKMKAEADTASALKQLLDPEKQAANTRETQDNRKKKGESYIDDKGNKMAGDKVWKKGQVKAKSEGSDLDALVKSRKGMKKGSDEYNAVQNKINSALGSKKVHGTKTTPKVDTKNITVTGGDGDKNAVVTRGKNQNASKITDSEKRSNRDVAKYDKRTGEGVENENKKTARANRKNAKKAFGKGSKEHLAAKEALLVAKEADRQGESGGRKRGLFRKLSSSINKKKQAKNKGKLKAAQNKADANYYQGSTDTESHTSNPNQEKK